MKEHEMPICFKSHAKTMFPNFLLAADKIHDALSAMDYIRPSRDEYGQNYEAAYQMWHEQCVKLSTLNIEVMNNAMQIREMSRDVA